MPKGIYKRNRNRTIKAKGKASHKRLPKGWFAWPMVKQEELSDTVNNAIDTVLMDIRGLSYVDRVTVTEFVAQHVRAV